MSLATRRGRPNSLVTISLHDQLQQALGAAYTVERELGGGGMSRVFVARDNALGRRVVVKLLSSELAATVSVERFRREIMLVAALQHPHIVGVLSAGQADGSPYYIMPYVEGESLRARLRRGRLGVVEAVRVLRDVARALAYAHEHGIVHRDIKPDNVLLAGGSAMVADFGVAKALSSALRRVSSETDADTAAATQAGTLTLVGTSLGTPAYMAPEQAAGDPDTDHRADIYAFGVMAYEMLAGALPFTGRSPQALLAAHLTEAPKPLPSHRGDIPAALADLVRRCLEKEPEHRPQTATDLAAALEDPEMVSGAFASAPAALTPSGTPSATPGATPAGTPAGVAAAPMPTPMPTPATVPVRAPRRPLLAAVAVAALLLGGGAVYWGARRAGAPAVPGAAAGGAPAAPVGPPARSIAVLPLVNIGRDSTDAYLAAGMTDELTSALSRVAGVRVASRTAAGAIQGTTSAAEIGKSLNVALLLEGTIQREGKRVRVTARLVNAADGYMLWSDVYDGAAEDVFALQDEVAGAVVDALSERFADADTAAAAAAQPAHSEARGTADIEAYNQYLRGRYFFQKRGEDALRKAIGFFRQAVAKDPRYALAYSGLADAYALLPLYGTTPHDSALRLAMDAAERSIALDSTLAEGYASRGNLLAASWRWADAERDFRRAVALAPGYATAHQWYGEYLLLNGRVDESVAEMRRAGELDPVSPIVAGSTALALAVAGRGDEALVRARQAVEMDPSLYVAHFMLGTVSLYAAKPAESIPELEAALQLGGGTVPPVRGMLGYAYAASGRREAALEILRALERERRGDYATALARVHLGLGDTAQALAWLERAADRRESFFVSESMSSRIFDPLRRSPRFAALVRRVGLDERLTRG